MKTLVLVSILLAAVAAAPEAPKPVTVAAPYRAGEQLLLIYSTDVNFTPTMGGVTATISMDKAGKVEKKVEKIDPPPGTSTEFGTLELPLLVTAGDKAREVRLAVTARRMVSGNKYVRSDAAIRQELLDGYKSRGVKPTPAQIEADMKKAREETHVEANDTADPKPARPDSVASMKDEIALVDLVATVADGRRLADCTPRGKLLAELDKIKDPKERPFKELMAVGKYRSLLEETVAYLPPQAVTPGQTWKVERKEVVPLHMYATYMALGGVQVLTESSECTFEGVRDSPQGRVAVIKVSGRRLPVLPPEVGKVPVEKMPRYFETKGEVQVNPETGALVSYRMESTLVSHTPEPAGAVVFIDTATLAPLGK